MTEADKVIHVAVAVLQSPQGEILLSKRKSNTHQGGLWEFPGGKVEAGESVENALERELMEELGIQLTDYRPLIKVPHQYPDCKVILDVYLVTAWQGEAKGLEGQPLTWVKAAALNDFAMPAADKPIVNAIQLPTTYLITKPQIADTAHFFAAMERSLKVGNRLVQLRVFDLAATEYRQLALRLSTLCQDYDAKLLLNGNLALAEELPAQGVHLSSQQLLALDKRPLGRDQLVAASCHNLAQLQKAEMLKLDFAVLSPVLETSSHPEATPLGWAAFSAMLESVAIPVYALGGMQQDMLMQAWQSGAQGIAGISAFGFDSAQPATTP